MTEPATAAREPWTRHAWDGSHKWCVECHQEWPCDIAKAWRGGYEWAETNQRLRELRAGRPSAAPAATCHHSDGWEHPSDGTLPCHRRRRFTGLRRWLRAVDEGFGYINLDGMFRGR